MENDEKYYVGLDCGTSSVGWAVTDPIYHLLRAKGKDLWGARLFDEAETAAKRRMARSSRRRTRRSADRIKLLNLLFQDEMAKVDPDFYLRLKKSFLQEEDKNLPKRTKNTLFDDPNYTDKDFHKAYPTIWHLRKALMDAPADQHFDLRLYYLAIHHILRSRGHFLRQDKFEGAGNFDDLFRDLSDACSNFDLYLSDSIQDFLCDTLTNPRLGIRDKRKELKESLFIETVQDENNQLSSQQDALCGLLAGAKIAPRAIFDDQVSKDAYKFSFADGKFEEKVLPELETEANLNADGLDLIEKAKAVYDYGLLCNLLSGERYISSAMVNNYDLHQLQLKTLKQLLKPFKEDYDAFFRTEHVSGNEICYNSYIGKAYTEKQGRRQTVTRTSQEDINKEILRLLEKNNIESDLAALAAEGKLLPKQRGQAKGTIPQQLHHNELEIILTRLARDYPSFAEVNPSEPDHCNTKVKKIASIHEFRIPYYCGPLVSKERSSFSWADAEVAELVRPWNFYDLVDLDTRANRFIRRMTNKCTYLPSKDVLPKSSLLYQKYMVLNELNNLKINGRRLEDVKVKQEIYERAFLDGELRGNITLRPLKKWLVDNGYLKSSDDLSGTAENKFLPKLSTHLSLVQIFGNNYDQIFKADDLEYVIELVTTLGDEPEMLRHKIRKTLGDNRCSEKQAKELARKSFKDWARFSSTFLTKILDDQNGSIIDALWNTNHNLMELLSSDYKYKDAIDEFNLQKNPPKTAITHEDVESLYCSPAVKRTLWQAIRILKEIVEVKNGQVPAKIFLESTRETSDGKGKESLSRHSKLLDIYRTLENSQDLLRELQSKEPRDLQNKKLFLYFAQMGRCAYSGERIELEELMTKAYDIDHIYPRSKTKDDSITRNLVLVKAEYNRDKSNSYPIEEKWRAKMLPTWQAWKRAGLITEEKYRRLSRVTPLTIDELSGFISRQIVETSQSVKALRGLLQQIYPETKIILVKAGQVSDFRHYFASGNTNSDKGEIFEPKPEFVKVRALNDLHHAKDAYLNIVVGNVMSETFTDNPFNWLKNPVHQQYSINPHNIWRLKPVSDNFPKAWYYSDTVDLVSKTLKKNSVLWTRMVHDQTGAISDLQPVGKSANAEGILPLKRGLDPTKYGGYNSIKGAYFALIELPSKTGLRRKLVQVPIYAKDAPARYLAKTYPEATVIIPKIPMNSLFEIDGNRMMISGRTNNSIEFFPAKQLCLDVVHHPYLKKVLSTSNKIRATKSYPISEKDGVSKEENLNIYKTIVDRLALFRTMPWLGGYAERLAMSVEKFDSLSIEEQCTALEDILAAFQSNPGYKNLSMVMEKASTVGKCRISNDISNRESAFLIHQSSTGLFERKINLLTVRPKE